METQGVARRTRSSTRVIVGWKSKRKKKKGGGVLLYRREKVLKAVWLAVVCGGVTGLERLSLGR